MRLELTDYVDCAHHLKGKGKCERPHGHTYRVDLAMDARESGPEHPDALWEKAHQVLDAYDHRDLNDLFEFPTCERFCVEVFREVKKIFPGLETVRVWEGQGKYAELSRGDEALRQ